MKTINFVKNKDFVFWAILLLIILSFSSFRALPQFALAESCPSQTIVMGTTVNFVGELADIGGDNNAVVWFEYGKTSNYGLKTAEKTLSQPGIFCIAVSGLEPCTTYHYRAAARNSAGVAYGENKIFTTSCFTNPSSVDLKVNNSDGPIILNYNSSATLSWAASNVNYCIASGDWMGTKPISGWENTGNLVSSKTYILTCYGPNGSVSDSVTILMNSLGNIGDNSFSIEKYVRNLSKGTSWLKSVSAEPGEVISFLIKVNANNLALNNVFLQDLLPEKMVYQPNSLKVDGISYSGDISNLNIGNLSPYQTRTITFEAILSSADKFNYGQNKLINTVSVFVNNNSKSDSAEIIVFKKGVAGIATAVSTGLLNNSLLNYFILPLILTAVIIWLLRYPLLKFEDWLSLKKKEYKSSKIQKLFQKKIQEKIFNKFNKQ